MNLKIKIMNRQQVSDEEIQSLMDFDAVLQKRNNIVHKRTVAVRAGLSAVGLIAIIAVYLLVRENNVTPGRESGQHIEREQLNSESSVSDDSNSGKEEESLPNLNDKDSVDEADDSRPAEKAVPLKKPVEQKAKPAEESAPVAESVYIQAEPIEGYEHLFEYLRRNVRYPSEAIKDSIQGVMTVSFVVSIDGRPDKISFERTLGEPFETEAIRLINQMPAWKPATLNGKPVRSKVSLPLTFELRKVRAAE